jgi:hypothetical protein
VEISPGQIVRLDPGEDVTVGQPADSGGNLRAVPVPDAAADLGRAGHPLPYLANDMVKGNFSNSRLALIEFRRRVSAWQHSVMVWQLCRPVYARWMDAAVLSGALTLPGYEANRARLLTADWLPTKWDWVDPLKDANAEIAQIEAGLKSRTQAIAERAMTPSRSTARSPRNGRASGAGPRLPPPGLARAGRAGGAARGVVEPETRPTQPMTRRTARAQTRINPDDAPVRDRPERESAPEHWYRARSRIGTGAGCGAGGNRLVHGLKGNGALPGRASTPRKLLDRARLEDPHLAIEDHVAHLVAAGQAKCGPHIAGQGRLAFDGHGRFLHGRIPYI